MEGKQKRESFRKKAGLLAHHLRPAASAFALGIGASLAATLLRTLFTQIIRFTVDHALLGETDGLPAFLLDAPAGRILVWCAAAAATVALLEFGAGFVQDSNLPKGSERFVKSLRDALYGHIQRLPYSWHVQNPTGDIIQRCTSDVEVVRNFIAEQMVELLSTNYSEYRCVDLDEDGRTDLFVLRFDAEQPQGVAELYRWQGDQMEREPEAYLTAGASPVKRIVSGDLMEDVPAVFVASAYEENGLATDVFAFRDGVFRNITAADPGSALSTVRSYYVYATDVDSDGLIELPQILPLPSAAGSEENYSVISWYNLDLQGRSTPKMTTYHSFSGGWFLSLPDRWQNRLCITRSEEVGGVRGYVFSEWKDETHTEPIFTIYAFSGDDRAQLASSDGRFLLAEKGDITYAAQLAAGKWAGELSEQTLRGMFHFIHIDWNSGET